MTPIMRCHEFVCIECGRQIVRIVHHKGDPDLCALCLMHPGWFRDAKLREILDPTHNGREEPQP